MLVKCRYCGNKVDRKEAYKVVVGGQNAYYCNEKEYLLKNKNKFAKDKVYRLINEIFGYEVKSIIYKEINEIRKTFSYEDISSYLESSFDYLHGIMCEKDFQSEYGKVRYFSAILKNNLPMFIYDNEMKVLKEAAQHEVNVDMPEMIYHRKKKRKPLIEIEQEAGDEL